MPRKYTRRIQPSDEQAPVAPYHDGMVKKPDPPTAQYAPQLTALEQYGLWLKANQHVTNPIIPEPPKPRKPAHVPRP